MCGQCEVQALSEQTALIASPVIPLKFTDMIISKVRALAAVLPLLMASCHFQEKCRLYADDRQWFWAAPRLRAICPELCSEFHSWLSIQLEKHAWIL